MISFFRKCVEIAPLRELRDYTAEIPCNVHDIQILCDVTVCAGLFYFIFNLFLCNYKDKEKEDKKKDCILKILFFKRKSAQKSSDCNRRSPKKELLAYYSPITYCSSKDPQIELQRGLNGDLKSLKVRPKELPSFIVTVSHELPHKV